MWDNEARASQTGSTEITYHEAYGIDISNSRVTMIAPNPTRR
jgi:hypothetical protein